jgi:hypothetical protein
MGTGSHLYPLATSCPIVLVPCDQDYDRLRPSVAPCLNNGWLNGALGTCADLMERHEVGFSGLVGWWRGASTQHTQAIPTVGLWAPYKGAFEVRAGSLHLQTLQLEAVHGGREAALGKKLAARLCVTLHNSSPVANPPPHEFAYLPLPATSTCATGVGSHPVNTRLTARTAHGTRHTAHTAHRYDDWDERCLAAKYALEAISALNATTDTQALPADADAAKGEQRQLPHPVASVTWNDAAKPRGNTAALLAAASSVTVSAGEGATEEATSRLSGLEYTSMVEELIPLVHAAAQSPVGPAIPNVPIPRTPVCTAAGPAYSPQLVQSALPVPRLHRCWPCIFTAASPINTAGAPVCTAAGPVSPAAGPCVGAG